MYPTIKEMIIATIFFVIWSFFAFAFGWISCLLYKKRNGGEK